MSQLGTTKWVSLLTDVAQAMNTTRSRSLPHRVTPYQAYKQVPPRWLTTKRALQPLSEEEDGHSYSDTSSTSSTSTSTTSTVSNDTKRSLPATNSPSTSNRSSLAPNMDDDLEERMGEETESMLQELDLDYLDAVSYSESFATASNAQEKAQQALEVTQLEDRVLQHKTTQAQKLVSKAVEEIEPLNVGNMATLKIPTKMRLSTELARLPVSILEVRERRQYKLMTEYGRLKGLRGHGELNPIKGGMAKSMGANIPCIQHPPKPEIELSVAVLLYNGGRTISGAQKAGRKRPAAVTEAPKAKAPRFAGLTRTTAVPRRKGAKPLVLPPPLTTRARSRAFAACRARK